MPAFFIGNIFTLFAATSLHFALFLQPFCKFRNLRIIPRNFAKSRNNSIYAEILCASNTENRRTVSRILAGIMQHIPGSSCNILPGSAPALRTISLYPFSPLPLPLAHPITLTPNPGAEPAPRPGCVNICFIFRHEHRRFPHILRQNRWRTLEQDSRLGDPFRGAVTGFGMQAGDTSPWA